MNSRLVWLILSGATGVAACGSNGAVSDGGGSDAGGHPGPVEFFHLIAPLSTATVTSRRPKLRWALGPGGDGAHVQICRDRACTVEVTSFDAGGTSGTPSGDLPTGVSFWRATPRGGDAGAAMSTPIWEFTVGALSAPVDTSWGTTLDVNGDGYADVVVGPHLYLGGPNGPATSPSVTLTDPTGVTLPFQDPAASAGDVNGDGYADFVAKNPGALGGEDAAYVYLGSASGLPTTPSFALGGAFAGSGLVDESVAGAGDVNGDGYADIVLGDPSSAGAYLFLGSALGPSIHPDLTLTGLRGAFASFVTSAGDVNGDGYGDLLVSVVSGFAYLYLGSATGLSTTALVALTKSDGTTLDATSVACAGDVNGDGYADLLVGAPPSAHSLPNNDHLDAFLYLGSASGPTATPSFGFSTVDGVFGTSAVGVGDVNGDGYADFVIGAPGGLSADGLPNLGSAYFYLGGAAGPSTTPALILANPDSSGGTQPFQGSMVGGDVNGDGFSDFTTAVVGSRQFGYVFLGSASGLSSAPSARLD